MFQNKRKWSIQPEINMTPFLDILLVLLIVFIVASPLTVTSINVKLPEISNKPSTNNSKFLSLIINKSGQYFVENRIILFKDLQTFLSTAKGEDDQFKLEIRADETVPYKYVMNAMSIANKIGIKSINMLGKSVQGSHFEK